ncbi:hypothetical protein B0T24DRAFT_677495 [Lasiosphaeria ovina]|uniref:Uncharacterized protein n=1 Tax=Lasiosphaeria ovina TaxID=92902 RepID=A0AAE0KGZ5_9PEZI|nr:hypothetical protein B0T24DRAFT_677495 [Lasiosphaeria ovina]
MPFVLPSLAGNPEGGDGTLFVPLDYDGPLSDLVPDGGLYRVAHLAYPMSEPDGLEPAGSVQNSVVTCGSHGVLASEDFFWAGTTLWDICFNDLKELHEHQQQLGLPAAPHHNGGMVRTTFDDILEIFSTVRPPLVGPEQPYIPSPTDPINGWVLAYLDGDVQSRRLFQNGVVVANLYVPCQFLVLETYEAPVRADYFDRLQCPPGTQMLIMMRMHYHDDRVAANFFTPC